MKIAAYNIMSGGYTRYNRKSTVPERIDRISEAVRTLDADVIGLIDTYRWNEIYDADELSVLFDYPEVLCVPLNDNRLETNGFDNGITVLSRVPETNFRIVRLFNRDAACVTIPWQAGTLTVFFVYLDDQSAELRQRQVRALLPLMPGGQAVVMGDFNTWNLHDYPIVGPILNAVTRLPVVSSWWDTLVEERTRTDVLHILEGHGLRSLTNRTDRTMPTRITEELPLPLPPAVMRIDYAYATGDVTGVTAGVAKGKAFDDASDHYPIILEFASG